jgi:DNA-binding response OmpR family regulator
VFIDWELRAAESGIEFVRAVRRPEMGVSAYVPLIMITSHSERDRVIEARDAGIHEFLVKPFSATTLLKRVTGVVNQPRRFVQTDSYFGPQFRTDEAALAEAAPKVA